MSQIKKTQVDASFYTKSNFGKKGWLVIIFVGLMLFFCTALTNDGLNVAVPQIAAENGLNAETLLAYSTPAGFISVIGFIILTKLTEKFGAKLVTIICIIGTAASTIWWGNASSLASYFISVTLVGIFAQGCSWIGGGAYLAEWFPKKKGLALGWATMGNNLASALIVPILTGLQMITGSFGMTMVIIGVVIAVTVVFAFIIPNKPEEMGATPDNLPMAKEEMDAYREEANAYVSPWTTVKLLKCKEVWLMTVVLGISMMVSTGIMSQLVTRLSGAEIGWDPAKAITTMTVVAVIGIVGSYIWGWLDQKITTRKTVAIFMIWYAAAIGFNIIPGDIFVYISIFMIGMAIGGNANWPVSLVSGVFGYQNFAKVYGVVMPLYTLIRCCSFAVLAFFIATTGSLSGAYIMFAALAVVGAILTLFIDDKKYADGTLGK